MRKVGIIGHVDHGKTKLAETKSIQETFDEHRSYEITINPLLLSDDWDFKSGQEKRRERRARQRKSKID